MAYGSLDTLSGEAEWPGELSPEYKHVLGVRVRLLRRHVAVRQLWLQSALKALDEFDRLLTTALDRDELTDGSETEQRYVAGEPAEIRTAQAEPVQLHRVFDELLREDGDKDWVRCPGGLRVPAIDEVNRRLSKFGLMRLNQDDLRAAYVDYLDNQLADGTARLPQCRMAGK